MKSPPSKNKGYVSEYNKKYYQNKRKELLAKSNLRYESDKKSYIEKQNQYKKKKYHNNPAFKLRTLISRAVSYGLSKQNQSVTKYLPYTFLELKNHLEILFEPWMNWNNHGLFNPKTWDDNNSSTWTWQIDHIIPHSNFKYSSMQDEEFQKCWSLQNLRPLSSKQNHIDGVSRSRHKEL